MNPVAFDTDAFLQARVVTSHVKPRIRLVNGWWECSSPGATGKAATPVTAWRAWYKERWAWLPRLPEG